MRRVRLVALALGTASGAASGAASLAAQPPDTVLPAPPGRLVDVGGRRLHLLCAGTKAAGAPTVVLEAGASSYVLVGASAGGLFVRHYAAAYPAEVAGLVFVDPATETRLYTLHRGDTVLIAALDAEQLRETVPARDVVVPKRAPQRGPPFDRLPAEPYAARLVLDRRLVASIPDTVPYAIVLESAESQRAGLARLRGAQAREPHPLGDRPIVVLTRGVGAGPGLHESHAYVAGLSTNARHTVVADAGHEIHLYTPAAVVQAVEDVVGAVRGGTRLPPRTAPRLPAGY